MRISATLISATAVLAGEKKVPPRHPRNRLKTLTRFTQEWLTKNFRNLLAESHPGDQNGERLANRFTKRFNYWGARLQKLVDDKEKECFFFDPNSPHGGRTRRDENGTVDEHDDYAYDYSEDADDLLRYDKNNPQRGLRQITTGFRKWAQRYISDCPGERKNKAHSQRADRLYRKILAEYNTFFNKHKGE
jgi:hypothetical protein